MAGGLNRNQQSDIVQRLLPSLLPKPGKKPQRLNNSLLREMWRTASSMELIPAANRTQLGDALIKQAERRLRLWCLSRLGARQLFYGPANQVLRPSVASRWIEALLTVRKRTMRWCRWRDARAIRCATWRPTTFTAVKRAPERPPDACSKAKESDERALGRIFGEDLPSGLVLTQ